mgnify:FL=1|jgi:hypothetical protein
MKIASAHILSLMLVLALAGCQSDAPGADGRYATHDRGTVYNGSGYGRWAP